MWTNDLFSQLSFSMCFGKWFQMPPTEEFGINFYPETKRQSYPPQFRRSRAFCWQRGPQGPINLEFSGLPLTLVTILLGLRRVMIFFGVLSHKNEFGSIFVKRHCLELGVLDWIITVYNCRLRKFWQRWESRWHWSTLQNLYILTLSFLLPIAVSIWIELVRLKKFLY